MHHVQLMMLHVCHMFHSCVKCHARWAPSHVVHWHVRLLSMSCPSLMLSLCLKALVFYVATECCTISTQLSPQPCLKSLSKCVKHMCHCSHVAHIQCQSNNTFDQSKLPILILTVLLGEPKNALTPRTHRP